MKTQTIDESLDIEWLEELGKELYYKQETKSDVYGKGIIYKEKDRNLTKKEIEKILSIVRSGELILYPTTTPFGFAPAFQIFKGTKLTPEIEGTVEDIFYFTENQSPEEYKFDKLSQTFLSARNLELMKFYGMDPSEVRGDREHYTY